MDGLRDFAASPSRGCKARNWGFLIRRYSIDFLIEDCEGKGIFALSATRVDLMIVLKGRLI